MDVMFIQASYFVFLTLANAADNSSSDEIVEFQKKTEPDFDKEETSQSNPSWLMNEAEHSKNLIDEKFEEIVKALQDNEMHMNDSILHKRLKDIDKSRKAYDKSFSALCDHIKHAELQNSRVKTSEDDTSTTQETLQSYQNEVPEIERIISNGHKDCLRAPSRIMRQMSAKQLNNNQSKDATDNCAAEIRPCFRFARDNYKYVSYRNKNNLSNLDQNVYKPVKKCFCVIYCLESLCGFVWHRIRRVQPILKKAASDLCVQINKYVIRSQKPRTHTELTAVLKNLSELSKELSAIATKKLGIFKSIEDRPNDGIISSIDDNFVVCNSLDHDRIVITGNVVTVKKYSLNVLPCIHNATTPRVRDDIESGIIDVDKETTYYLPYTLITHISTIKNAFCTFESNMSQHLLDTHQLSNINLKECAHFYDIEDDYAGNYDNDYFSDTTTDDEDTEETETKVLTEEVIKMRERRPFLLNRSKPFLIDIINSLTLNCDAAIYQLSNFNYNTLIVNGIEEIVNERFIKMSDMIYERLQNLRNKLEAEYNTDYDYIFHPIAKLCTKIGYVFMDESERFSKPLKWFYQCVDYAGRTFDFGFRPLWRCLRTKARIAKLKMFGKDNDITIEDSPKDIVKTDNIAKTPIKSAEDNDSQSTKPNHNVKIQPSQSEPVIEIQTNTHDEKPNDNCRNKTSDDSTNNRFFLYLSCILILALIYPLYIFCKNKLGR